MRADIDLLFAAERAMKRERVTNPVAKRLAYLSLAEWKAGSGYDCIPFIDALSFQALGTGGGLKNWSGTSWQ